jgi:hypothetical protein
MKNFIKTSLAVLVVLLVKTSDVRAQHNLTLYGMKSLPQRTYANPAFRPDSRIFIGVPALSSHYFDIGNSSLRLRNISNAIERVGPDSTILHVNKLSDVFRENNSFNLQYDLDLLHFGFKLGNNYLSFNSTLVNTFKISIPGDFFQFFLEGNGGQNLGRKFDFGISMDVLQYGEFGLGYSRNLLNDRLVVGARAKYLKGINNFTTAKSDISFTTDPDDYSYLITADMEINAASSLGEVSRNGPEIPTSFSVSDILKSGNSGWGLDLGATYDLTKRIELSAAVKNLGQITWNTNTYNLRSRNPGATFRFEGIDFADVLDSNGGQEGEAMEALVDSLIDKFALDSFTNSYKTGLFPEFYLGGTFSVTKNHRAGILFYGSWFQKSLHPAFTLSWYSQFSRVLGISATYTIMDNSFNNAGLGISLNGGPIQFYAVADNIIGLIAADEVKNLGVRAGINVTLLRTPKEKKDFEKK